MKTASAEDLFATYKSERPVSATRNVIAHLYRTDPHKRVRVPDEAFDYVCEHPEETGDLMDALLWPVRGQTTRAAVGADFERQIAKSVELLVEASLKDDRYTPTKGLAEGISRPLLARFLGRAVSGRMDSERGETMARRRSDFETAATYCGHETLHSRLLAYLEKSAPVEQRIRAVTYLHLAFDAFPKTARETHTRLMELLPALEKEYGVTRDAPEAKSGEGRLVALVREQVERASRTIRDAEEAGMPEGVTDLYWLVSFALCDGAPIEFFKEPPFEWRKPLSEIAQFAQRYNVGSLEALHGIEGLTIEEEGSRSWKALDEKRGLELEAREFSDDSLYVEVSSLSDNQAEQRRVSLIFRRDSRTLVQVGNGGRMWPGIGLILFHQNGKLKSLTYSDGGRGWFAGFDEDGEPVECYSVRLEDGKPFSK
ncbi:MAG: hypothetical protein GY851_04195 [bacterium]|nr:hypothetical protein [bacterium]